MRAALRFADHHVYRRSDIERIRNTAGRTGAGRIVTTEKDWVKLRVFDLPFETSVARLDVSVEGLTLEAMTKEPQAVPAARSQAAE